MGSRGRLLSWPLDVFLDLASILKLPQTEEYMRFYYAPLLSLELDLKQPVVDNLKAQEGSSVQ